MQATATKPSIHDDRRKQSLITALGKAREKANECWIYLTANDRDPEEIANMALAVEHIDAALKHLGVE